MLDRKLAIEAILHGSVPRPVRQRASMNPIPITITAIATNTPSAALIGAPDFLSPKAHILPKVLQLIDVNSSRMVSADNGTKIVDSVPRMKLNKGRGSLALCRNRKAMGGPNKFLWGKASESSTSAP